MSIQTLTNAGTGTTQTSATLTPQDSTGDFLFFLTNYLFASVPAGWTSVASTSGFFYLQTTNQTPVSLTTSADVVAQVWSNVLASITYSGSPAVIQNWGLISGAWSQGTQVTSTSPRSATAGNTIFVIVQGTPPNAFADPTISDSVGNTYVKLASTNFNSGTGYGAGSYLYAATNKTTVTLGVTFTSGCLVSGGNVAAFEYSGLTPAINRGIIAEPQIDAYPTGVNNEFVRFRLRNLQGQVPQWSAIPIVVTATLDAGAISQAVVPNSAIVPSGTFYTVEIWSNGRITSSGNYLLNSNIDLSNAVHI